MVDLVKVRTALQAALDVLDEAEHSEKARGQLVRSLRHAETAATTLPEKFTRLRFAPYASICILIAQETGILERLAETQGELCAADLAVATGVEEGLIGRVMRSLTENSIADEVGPFRYTANDLTKSAIGRGARGDIKYNTHVALRICSNIGPMLADGELHEFPTGSQVSPFQWTFGKPMFAYLQDESHIGKAFDDFMEFRKSDPANYWHRIYRIDEALLNACQGHDDRAVLLVDIGGGQGHWTQLFRNEFSDRIHGRLIVQDQIHVVKDLRLDGVEAMEHDFFQAQPIRGARVYLLKGILHDWPPADCLTILRHTAAAMKKGFSTLLINELLLLDQKSSHRAIHLDIAMSLLLSGEERTEYKFTRLIEAAGLKLVKVWRPSAFTGDCEAVLECEL